MNDPPKMVHRSTEKVSSAIDVLSKAEEPKKVSSRETKVETKKVSSRNTKVEPKPKNLGGRPTNEAKGIKSRKQYTLTLKEDTYKLILEKAREEDISFAKYVERAVLEYMVNHK